MELPEKLRHSYIKYYNIKKANNDSFHKELPISILLEQVQQALNVDRNIKNGAIILIRLHYYRTFYNSSSFDNDLQKDHALNAITTLWNIHRIFGIPLSITPIVNDGNISIFEIVLSITMEEQSVLTDFLLNLFSSHSLQFAARVEIVIKPTKKPRFSFFKKHQHNFVFYNPVYDAKQLKSEHFLTQVKEKNLLHFKDIIYSLRPIIQDSGSDSSSSLESWLIILKKKWNEIRHDIKDRHVKFIYITELLGEKHTTEVRTKSSHNDELITLEKFDDLQEIVQSIIPAEIITQVHTKQFIPNEIVILLKPPINLSYETIRVVAHQFNIFLRGRGIKFYWRLTGLDDNSFYFIIPVNYRAPILLFDHSSRIELYEQRRNRQDQLFDSLRDVGTLLVLSFQYESRQHAVIRENTTLRQFDKLEILTKIQFEVLVAPYRNRLMLYSGNKYNHQLSIPIAKAPVSKKAYIRLSSVEHILQNIDSISDLPISEVDKRANYEQLSLLCKAKSLLYELHISLNKFRHTREILQDKKFTTEAGLANYAEKITSTEKLTSAYDLTSIKMKQQLQDQDVNTDRVIITQKLQKLQKAEYKLSVNDLVQLMKIKHIKKPALRFKVFYGTDLQYVQLIASLYGGQRLYAKAAIEAFASRNISINIPKFKYIIQLLARHDLITLHIEKSKQANRYYAMYGIPAQIEANMHHFIPQNDIGSQPYTDVPTVAFERLEVIMERFGSNEFTKTAYLQLAQQQNIHPTIINFYLDNILLGNNKLLLKGNTTYQRIT